MRKQLLRAFTILAVAVTAGTLHSTPFGAPTDGRTGSPGDGGKTCVTSGCHSGAVNSTTTIISSNVPAEGYTPGSTYTITVSVDGSGKKGFCVSPQDASGNVLGTLAAGTGNAVTGKGYMTHTSAVSTNPAVWTFSWTAPAAGTGTVNFYGAFATTKFSTRKQVFPIAEKSATGIREQSVFNNLDVYPNPVRDGKVSLSLQLKRAVTVQVSIINIQGQEVMSQTMEGNTLNRVLDCSAFENGVYFLRVTAGTEVITKKLLFQ